MACRPRSHRCYDHHRCRQALTRRRIQPRIARRGIESSQRLGRRRWVVERTLAWFAQFRRLAIRYERRADIHLAFSRRHAPALQRAGRPVPAGWKSHRAGLRQARTATRFDLHSLTPSTAEAAVALVAYYRDRAATSGEPATAHHAAQRRLRKVFRRPGAASPA